MLALSQHKHKKHLIRLGIIAIIIASISLQVWHYRQHRVTAATHEPSLSFHAPKSEQKVTMTQAARATEKPMQAPASTPCSSNTLAKNIIIDITDRHLWACEKTSSVHDAPVVTGMENLAADLTPTGTYQIYGKQTNIYLKGSDSTGSWNDYVSYWMPFLHNQYGSYGFHAATWRADSDFGAIDPWSDKGSHGCVELPLATAKWLYNWAAIGTTVTIKM